MRFAMFPTMKRVVIGGLCAGALAAGACARPRGSDKSRRESRRCLPWRRPLREAESST